MFVVTAHPYLYSVPFLLVIVGIGWLLVWTAERSSARTWLQSCAGVAAPVASVLALLFGLFSAFLANDVSIHAERAQAAVSREASATVIVLNITASLGERGEALRRLSAQFGRTLAGPDWPSATQADAANEVSLKMLNEILFGGLAGADPQVRQALFAAINEMRAARGEMDGVAHSQTSWLKWNAALILGILTMIGLVVIHLGKIRPMMLAVTLFAVGMAFMLWVILMRLDPYKGQNSVSLSPIAAAYNRAALR